MSRLSCWLGDHGLGPSDVSEERISEFLGFQRASGRNRAQWSRPGLMCLLEMLRQSGTAPAARPPGRASAEDLLLASFERYLLAERGLAQGTIQGYWGHARRFVDGFAPPGGTCRGERGGRDHGGAGRGRAACR